MSRVEPRINAGGERLETERYALRIDPVEATSALDDLSEAAICRTLQRLKGRLTILAVSHRPALAEIADRVYRLPAPARTTPALTAIKVARDCAPAGRANPVP